MEHMEAMEEMEEEKVVTCNCIAQSKKYRVLYLI